MQRLLYILILLVSFCLTTHIMAATGNKWEARSLSRRELLIAVNNVSALVPGTAGNDAGSAALYYGDVYAKGSVWRTQAVTANTTINATSPFINANSNVTSYFFLVNGTTAALPTGWTRRLFNSGTGGNVTVNTTSLINGAGNVQISPGTGLDVTWMGSTFIGVP